MFSTLRGKSGPHPQHRRGKDLYQASAAAAEAAGEAVAPAEQWNAVPSTRHVRWSKGCCDYRRLLKERGPSQSHAHDNHHRSVSALKRSHLLFRKPTLLNKRPQLLARSDGGYYRYYSHVDYRVSEEVYNFSHDQRSGPFRRGDRSGYRWARANHSTSWKPDYKNMRGGFRRKGFYSFHYSREQSTNKRDAPFFRESSVGQKNFSLSRSGSSVSGSYCSEQNKILSSHQSHHRNKERSIQSLKTSRDTSSSHSSAGFSFKVLDEPSSVTKKKFETEKKWAKDLLEKSDKNNLAEICEFEDESKAPLFTDQTEEPKSNTDGTEICEDSQLSSRTKAIAMKTKEIERVYHQDCETFGMVVKMLVEKDPSLEKSIQFSLRQNLQEIGERCVEELKNFISEYDNSTQAEETCFRSIQVKTFF